MFNNKYLVEVTMKKRYLSMVFILICTIELFPQKVGDAYALDINNIYMPLNRKGVLADVNVPPLGTGGQFGGHTFLFSGGFFLSGYSNGILWANGVASASFVEDYLPGTVGFPNNPDAQLYKIRSDDTPFGLSWQDWSDAVSLGADFYDGGGDGVYNPVDKNGNGSWELDEDKPDILGDDDATAENPVRDLDLYLDHFANFINETAAVVGITRSDLVTREVFLDIHPRLEQRQQKLPLFEIDAARFPRCQSADACRAGRSGLRTLTGC